jgi:riboflavin-specific deaminase-like protein
LRFERLHPPGPPAAAVDLLSGAGLRERAGADRPYVFVNMVATIDGRAAFDGRAAALGSEADLEMLLELRAAADAILIGTGTLRAEGYARLMGSAERRARREAAGLAADPVAVLLSQRLDLPWEAGLFADPAQPVLVYAGADADRQPPAVAAPVEVVRLVDPSPRAALADLRARGVRSLLCEGGPRLNRSLLGDGLVDELFLTLSPIVTGDDTEPAIVAGPRLPEPSGLELRWLLRAGGDLFLRWAIAPG